MPKSYTPVLIVLLLIAVFLLGMLVMKIHYLEQNGTYAGPAQQQAAQQAAPAGPLHLAKAIGLDAKKFNSCLDSNKYAQKVADDLAAGQKVGVTGTPALSINGNIVVGAQPFDAFKAAIDQELQNPGAPLPSGERQEVEPGDLPAQGNANAPVTIVEFADFQCPFCERFYTQTEKQIIDTYVKTGKAKFIFRNYAFLGPDSTTAAEAAYCANEQGKFWQFHNFMYEHQGQENSGWTTKANLES